MADLKTMKEFVKKELENPSEANQNRIDQQLAEMEEVPESWLRQGVSKEKLIELAAEQSTDMALGVLGGGINIVHPATYTNKFLPIFEKILKNHNVKTVLDVFGGTGKLGKIKEHGYKGKVITNELEPEWAKLAKKNKVDLSIVGDAQNLGIKSGSMDAVVTSPAYGNSLAAKRKLTHSFTSYSKALGRPLSEGSGAGTGFTKKYKEIHENAWSEVSRVLKDDGIFVLNVKDFIRKGEVIPVTQWHIDTILQKGFKILSHQKVPTKGLKLPYIKTPTVGYENVITFQKK